jgi:hypothetical protein
MGMGTSETAITTPGEGTRRRAATPTARGAFMSRIRTGGTVGNERLTTVTGTILLVQLAVIGVTIVDHRRLVWVHLFVGLLLLGPVLLKLASTGYRFARYYTGTPAYRRKGPPPLILRLIGPMVVLSTLAVFATGGILLLVGPHHSNPWLLLHKAAFIIWTGAMSLHVLGHLPAVAGALGVRPARGERRAGALPGAGGRWFVVTTAVLGGLILALAFIPDFSAWTASAAAHPHLHTG